MPFYDAGDAAMYYEIGGAGPPLVMLHGYALNGLMWELQRPAFAKSNTVMTVDLRGFGKSSCGQEWSADVIADDVIGLIRELGLCDATILGFSMSGPVAMRVAYEMPGTVTRLILASSILPSANRPKSTIEEQQQSEEMDVLRLHGCQAWADFIGLSHGPMVDHMLKRNPAIGDIWKRMIARHNPDFLLGMMAERMKSSLDDDRRERLKEIKQPTLVIAGERDRRLIDASRHLAREIPKAQLAIIHGAGHMANLEAPEEFEKIVLGFLAGN